MRFKAIFTIICTVLLYASVACGADMSFTIGWQLPATYDISCAEGIGDPIPSADLPYYITNVYYRVNSDPGYVKLMSSPEGATSITGTVTGVHYGDVVTFALKGELFGMESCQFSNEMSKQVPFPIPVAPLPPTMISLE